MSKVVVQPAVLRGLETGGWLEEAEMRMTPFPRCLGLPSMAAPACVLGMFAYTSVRTNRTLVCTLHLLLLLVLDLTEG